MSKKAEIEKQLEVIWSILLDAKDCFHYTYYLYNPKSENEKEYLRNSDDLRFIRHALLRMTIIELCKLYSNKKDRDYYCLLAFINKFGDGQYYADVGIESQKVHEWKKQIENNPTVKKIQDLRDKAYAHTDKNKDSIIPNEISFDELKHLLSLAEEIVQYIYERVYDVFADMDTPYFDSKRVNILEVLAEEKKNRSESIIKQEKGSIP